MCSIFSDFIKNNKIDLRGYLSFGFQSKSSYADEKLPCDDHYGFRIIKVVVVHPFFHFFIFSSYQQ
jgi:hypothetical protein